MSDEEKYNLIEELNCKLDKLNTTLKRSSKNIKLRIDRDRLRREIKELKDTMTDEEFEEMMSERSEIDTRKC